MSGFPLGDLYHWYPEQYEQWKVQENAEHARISHWLNVGTDSIFTHLEKQSDSDIPKQFKLSQNYPNPFNATTKIKYTNPQYGYISLKIYDLLGKEVTTLVKRIQNAGQYEVIFNGTNLTSGVYIYQLRTDNHFSTKKFLLLK